MTLKNGFRTWSTPSYSDDFDVPPSGLSGAFGNNGECLLQFLRLANDNAAAEAQ